VNRREAVKAQLREPQGRKASMDRRVGKGSL